MQKNWPAEMILGPWCKMKIFKPHYSYKAAHAHIKKCKLDFQIQGKQQKMASRDDFGPLVQDENFISQYSY